MSEPNTNSEKIHAARKQERQELMGELGGDAICEAVKTLTIFSITQKLKGNGRFAELLRPFTQELSIFAGNGAQSDDVKSENQGQR